MRKSARTLTVEFLGGRCTRCSSTERLELHHVKSVAEGGDEGVAFLNIEGEMRFNGMAYKRWPEF